MMAGEGRRRCGQEMDRPLKSEEVGKSADGEVEHDVHASGMDNLDELLPV